MLCAYGASVAGPRHLERGVPCQDSCVTWVSDDGTMAVAAVADGLGSERFSDEGSAVACETAVASICDWLASCGDDECSATTLRDAFATAWQAVCAHAQEQGQPIDEYDTTLCLAVFAGGRLLWGQSGDSGLVACHADGTYELVTSMQRTEDGLVYPLCYSDHWEFGCLEDVATVLLCTDGVLEGMIAPPVLAVHADSPIDREKASQFLHPQASFSACLPEVEKSLRAYLEAYPQDWVDDDKTVVVVFDDASLPERQDEAYYAAPDWDAIYARVNEALYGAVPDSSAPADNPADNPSDDSSDDCVGDAGDREEDSRSAVDSQEKRASHPSPVAPNLPEMQTVVLELAGAAEAVFGVGIEMGRALRRSMEELSRTLRDGSDVPDSGPV